MKSLKRISGVLWIILAIAAAWFCVDFGWPRFTSGKQDDLVFGIILLFILTPLIAIGLGTFGYYALVGEYDDV
ncbi:MAG: hypothetical protein EOP46_19965 [Sphingobacteriaceae bacterium]|nr:MAG: hypothetical protein EOP46_19965 [Sphingobacteriaceae bacterium]